MEINKDYLLKQKEELKNTLKQIEGDWTANNGALQFVDHLLIEIDKPIEEQHAD